MPKKSPFELSYEEALKRKYERMQEFDLMWKGMHPDQCLQGDPYELEDEFLDGRENES